MQPEDIRTIRKRLNLNQTEFGKLLGVSKNAVAFWESGRSNISTTAEILLSYIVKEREQPHYNDNISTAELIKTIENQSETIKMLTTLIHESKHNP